MITPFLLEVIEVNPKSNETMEVLGISDERGQQLFEVAKKALVLNRTKTSAIREISKHCNTSNELVASLIMVSNMVGGL